MSLKIGDRINLNIHDVAFGGEGVGRVEEFVVFVPFVMVGETVTAEITEVKKNFARAKLLARGKTFAGPGDAGMPVFHPLRRLPVSAHGVSRAVADEAEADRRPL